MTACVRATGSLSAPGEGCGLPGLSALSLFSSDGEENADEYFGFFGTRDGCENNARWWLFGSLSSQEKKK